MGCAALYAHGAGLTGSLSAGCRRLVPVDSPHVTDARTQAPDPADSEQTVVRKEKRERLLVAGTQPYPAA